MRINFLTATAVVCAVLSSCGDQYTICGTSKRVNLNAGFYHLVNNVPTLQPVPSFSLSILNGAALFTQAANQSQFGLELSPAKDSLSYQLSIGGSPADTLVAVYTTQVQNLSVDCGSINVYNLQRVYCTTHQLDSVRIVNAQVSNMFEQNIQIYY